MISLMKTNIPSEVFIIYPCFSYRPTTGSQQPCWSILSFYVMCCLATRAAVPKRKHDPQWVNVRIEHHPQIGDMISNRYCFKCEINPQMLGTLAISPFPNETSEVLASLSSDAEIRNPWLDLACQHGWHIWFDEFCTWSPCRHVCNIFVSFYGFHRKLAVINHRNP